MPKFKLSLKAVVTLSFVGLILAIVVVYSVFSLTSFKQGVESNLAGGMEEAAKAHIEFRHLGPNERVRKGPYVLTKNPELLPSAFLDRFKVHKLPPSKLLIGRYRETKRGPEEILLLMAVNTSEGIVYVGRSLEEGNAPDIVEQHISAYFLDFALVTLAFLITVALLFTWFLKRMALPVKALGRWAKALDSHNYHEPVPDFSYPELNDLAHLLQDSFTEVHSSLTREQAFLRYASHELRTPIAVVCSNIELLKKQLHNDTPAALQRIERAGTNMKHLTETLLWLNYEQTEQLSTQDCALDQLVKNLTEEHQYLLTGKTVDLSIDTEPHTLPLPLTAARIVLSNLIRNAFQHTWSGKVSIRQKGNQVTIHNIIDCDDTPNDGNTSEPQELGFGLGLMLLTQICDRLGWQHSHHLDRQGCKASLTFTSE